ncbi:MAG TPA: hypothetical protein VFR81_10420 [Longimicrobium sp.]|nr:hypothetical protein [Longimicrobium sp.]
MSAQSFECYQVLDELPSETGLVIFEWLRAVYLWSGIDERERLAGLFQPLCEGCSTSWGAASVDAALAPSANAFRQLVMAPERIRPDGLVHACVELSDWASDQGYPATSALFAEAASALSPEDPDLAFRAGRANRRNVAHGRAVLWFQRGTGMARRTANWQAYVDCWLGWGNLEIVRGRFDAARRLLIRAYRASQKYNLPELGAAAQHDLFMLCVEQRQFSNAYKHAAEALEAYSPDHPSYPYIVHDLAQTWARDGYGSVALPLLVAVRQFITAPSAQIQIAGNIAGAAGLVGDMDQFYAAWDYVSKHATRPMPYVAAALATVAEGAFALRLNRQASEAAASALRFAQQRQEVADEKRASELLDKLRQGASPAPPRDPPEAIRNLAATLLSRLQERTEQG